ncbi:MAG: DEAD/DEAH box helicase [Lewinellaceae bacterium]|nr:DEAD/DEAH box helicase [Lewinellaceae bacterium]
MNFTEFDLHPDLLDGIDALNFTTATPIQEKAIPLILEGKDIIGVAQTGTGKTAAFVLPILNEIIESGESNFTQAALVIVPTRELATQIDQVVAAYSYFTGVSSIAVYGGGDGKGFHRKKLRSPAAPTIIASGAPDHTLTWVMSTFRACDSWCSTRPTGCSTWVSSPIC